MTAPAPVALPLLWISNGGEIACVKHGGAYLESAVRAHPRRRTHTTPLDHWVRATDADRDAWPAELGEFGCETCQRQAPR